MAYDAWQGLEGAWLARDGALTKAPLGGEIGSDFDHGDAVTTWPKTVQTIKSMPRLSEDDKERVLGRNAMWLFGLNGNGAVRR